MCSAKPIHFDERTGRGEMGRDRKKWEISMGFGELGGESECKKDGGNLQNRKCIRTTYEIDKSIITQKNR